MATRKPSQPPTPHHADLTSDAIRAAIPKLQRRIKEIEAFDPTTLTRRFDPSTTALENKIEGTLVEVLGHGTIEFNRFHPTSIDMGGISFGGETPLYQVMEDVREGLDRAKSNLQTLIEVLQERLNDAGESPAARARRAFGDMNLHPEIAGACATLFANGHYANAVETACKVLDGLVKIRSGKFELGGTELMDHVFSPRSPVLKFNDQITESDKSEQQGMHRLYSGAMLAFRNPRAHGIFEDGPDQALDLIGTLSMLAKALDRAKKA
jgi:uncharacterized protein (TIGR02391 family)